MTPEKAKPTPDASVRELMVVREIAHAFLTADRPEEVFQFALERVSPLVGATFASIYLIEPGDEQMRLAAAYNWPEKFRPFLGEMRVKVGLGPSGEAVSERHAITIPNVFADETLSDWQEVAKELGFRALVALPLSIAGHCARRGHVLFRRDRRTHAGAERTAADRRRPDGGHH